MRGRKPRPLTLPEADVPILEFIAHDRRLAWFQVQHARIVLAVAAGQRIGEIANRLECDRTTVWRVCRRYRAGGVRNILADDPRSGHPQEISPPPARPDRRVGLPGTAGQGVAHHPLVQRSLGWPSHRRRNR